MGIYDSRTPKTITIYRDGGWVAKVELLAFDADEYTDECGFVGLFSSFCSVNGTTTYDEKILTLDQIKEHQREERDCDVSFSVKITERPLKNNEKKKENRMCVLI